MYQVELFHILSISLRSSLNRRTRWTTSGRLTPVGIAITVLNESVGLVRMLITFARSSFTMQNSRCQLIWFVELNLECACTLTMRNYSGGSTFAVVVAVDCIIDFRTIRSKYSGDFCVKLRSRVVRPPFPTVEFHSFYEFHFCWICS